VGVHIRYVWKEATRFKTGRMREKGICWCSRFPQEKKTDGRQSVTTDHLVFINLNSRVQTPLSTTRSVLAPRRADRGVFPHLGYQRWMHLGTIRGQIYAPGDASRWAVSEGLKGGC
jgi:hypothetical protein